MNRLADFKRNLEKTSKSRNELVEKYILTRRQSTKICSVLENEDFVVQPCAEVSPPKWHLAHTTWFFEELILVQFSHSFTRFNDDYRVLFNSYYKMAGLHWVQGHRGHLSRPTVNEIFQYRNFVDEKMVEFLNLSSPNSEVDFLLEVGLHHEQQHQELLIMDIKKILGTNPLNPRYSEVNYQAAPSAQRSWQSYEEGLYDIGHEGQDFAYDNEGPRHKIYNYPFSIRENTVSNGEFLEFVNDKGYFDPRLWLSEGWDWRSKFDVTSPMYWREVDGQWLEFTLHGLIPLDLEAPVTHVSYFEADAFANWTDHRLPTEGEQEVFLTNQTIDDSVSDLFHPNDCAVPVHQVWCWSKSHYSPYPGYKTFKGMLGEYNGKFMCNQFVLKGGCIATPSGHYRDSYRNFYQPHQRWMFSGIRIAKDL